MAWDAAAIARAAAGRRIVSETLWCPVIDSTQDEARRHGPRKGAGLLVVAGEQRAGRGRRGRRWFSPPGEGLWLSLLVAPERPRAEWPLVTQLTGLALRAALRDSAGLACGIKWPNDLLCRGRKLAGILAEAGTEPWLVLGLGVNLGQSPEAFPTELRDRATSVRIETGAAPDPGRLLAAFLEHLERRLERFAREGAGAFREALQAASLLIGRRVTIGTTPDAVDRRARSARPEERVRPDGPGGARGRRISGLVTGIGARGELRLVPEGVGASEVGLASGEVLAVEPPLRPSDRAGRDEPHEGE